MVSDGKETFLDGQVLVRLNNCSEQDASLNLTVPGAQYLQGEFGVMNFYQNDASYSRAGSLPERQLVLGRRPNVQRIPESCAKLLDGIRCWKLNRAVFQMEQTHWTRMNHARPIPARLV